MGVRTQINIDEIKRLLPNFDIMDMQATTDGISDTTYILEDRNNIKYILKIYEFASLEEVENEIKILNNLSNLSVPKYLDINTTYQNKPVALFSYIEGKSLNEIKICHIEKIGKFLGKFHNISKNLTSINDNIYNQTHLKLYIDNIIKSNKVNSDVKNMFMEKYKEIENLNLDINGVIHGDLFPDNAKFIDCKLSGVFDFIESCNGNFAFDLSVVINSWCFIENNLEESYLNTILENYNEEAPIKFSKNLIKKYMKYASLFYAIQRFHTKYIEKRAVNVKDYMEYIIKYENI